MSKFKVELKIGLEVKLLIGSKCNFIVCTMQQFVVNYKNIILYLNVLVNNIYKHFQYVQLIFEKY